MPVALALGLGCRASFLNRIDATVKREMEWPWISIQRADDQQYFSIVGGQNPTGS
jgi:hypothetical protein